MDQLPDAIRNSKWLTGNELGQLANVHALPDPDPAFTDTHVQQIVQYYNLNPESMEQELHQYAKQLLAEKKLQHAWQVLLVSA
jgi:hypothetical protein